MDNTSNRSLTHSISTGSLTIVLIVLVGFAVSAGSFASVASSQEDGTSTAAANYQFLGKLGDTAAVPSFSWKNDTDTGIFRSNRNVVGIATGGTARAWFTDDGLTLVSSANKLTANSDSDLKIVSGYTAFGSGTSVYISPTGAGNVILAHTGSSAIGNVGIGDASPAALLTVGNGDRFQVDGSGNVTAFGEAKIVKSVTIGKSGAPKGITLYDEVTGAAFCVTVKSGLLVTTAGACE